MLRESSGVLNVRIINSGMLYKSTRISRGGVYTQKRVIVGPWLSQCSVKFGEGYWCSEALNISFNLVLSSSVELIF